MTRTLSLDYGGIRLVLGLEWFALLDAAPSRAARRLARDHRASHMVVLDAFPGAVGLADLPSDQGLRGLRRSFQFGFDGNKSPMHSAAQLFAHLFPSGTVAMLLDVQPDLVWLVAAHEGVVIARSDRLYAERDAGNAAVAELRAAYPQLLILGGDGAPPCPELGILCQHASPASQLVPCSRWRGPALSPTVGVVVLLIAIFFVAKTGKLIQPYQPASFRSAPSTASAYLPPEGSAVPLVHGVDGLRGLLHIFHALPATVGGWSLDTAQCDAALSRWQCSAHYRRSHPQASNRSLLGHAQAQWRISFPSMNEARVVWTTDARGIGLDALVPMSSGHNDTHLLSALQAMQPAFTHLHVGVPEPMAQPSAGMHSVVSPLRHHDEYEAGQQKGDGAYTAANYVSRFVNISGPLRSASLLIDHAAFISWTRAVLDHRPIDSPDARRSSLNLSLEGTLYETTHSPENHAMADDDAGVLDFLLDTNDEPGLGHEPGGSALRRSDLGARAHAS